ncbi:hypothetical protein [Streptomyces hoynatensis]|uniref:Uncharacterized protein n=1 Tax=Streptomyces hoynatensis TaxID=1141874 RepID=A0A3A9Z8X4_9ACTN|nr:hypothetical protein [Streptomyces hoynatensis]RKN44922.1 hypothetical protein D7294_07385 [Streptomyces hoynatensis]
MRHARTDRAPAAAPRPGTAGDPRPPRITATVPVGVPPLWALLERRLFDALDEAWRAFARRYCEPDGRLRHEGPMESRDGADDFYEAFFNWPTLYRLGGADDLLEAAKHHWRGVTAQLTATGHVVDEFERGYDWFHMGESLLLFYGICAADPGDAEFRERARRFAELYLPSSPAGNYDRETRTIRAPHNGARGPRYGVNEEWSSYGAHLTSMRPYGLPLRDLPGITCWADLGDPGKAARMGAAMGERLGRGDVAVNLAATSLATNAWLYDHDDRFRSWALDYLAAWWRRTEDCGGILPDNVGPSGLVGELHGGRWYGGSYGWTWPHGIYSVGNAAAVAAVNSVLLTGTTAGLGLGRAPLDLVAAHAATGSVVRTEMSIRDRWEAELGEDVARRILLVPNRYADGGWFDYQPPQLGLPVWLWQAGGAAQDAARLEWLRQSCGYDWRTVRGFRNKEEAGHEAPWLMYLRGENPDYPTAALGAALAQVERRMALIAADRTEPGRLDIHHWQRHNPVLTEALLQLTCGTPQVLYNGGLLPLRLAWEDTLRGRPGLPPGVAALVEEAAAERVCVQLVHTGLTGTRRVLLRAGGFGEHRIDTVRADLAEPGYPGDPRACTAPAPATGTREMAVGGPGLEVELPPGRRIRLELHLTPRAYRAAHHRPGRPGS